MAFSRFVKGAEHLIFFQTLINFCQIKSVILMWLMRPCRRWLKSLVSSQWHSYYSLTLGHTSSKGYCFFFRYVCSWRLSTYFSGRVFMVSCCSTSVRCNEYLNWRSLIFSIRVPDDSDSQSGVIKQRQNCLESRKVEGQEMPVLTLAPCTGTEGVPAINQVGQSAVWKEETELGGNAETVPTVNQQRLLEMKECCFFY